MSKIKKIFLGALTIWPLLYFFLFISGMGMFATRVASDPSMVQGDQAAAGLVATVGLVIIGHLLTAIVGLSMVIYYIVHVLKNNKVPQNQRIWWILGFFFCGGIPQVVYYFMHVWTLPEP